MQKSLAISTQACEIPAEIFNRISLVRNKAEGYLSFELPGLSNNVLVITRSEWRCYNRRLDNLLLTWNKFHNGQRQNLAEPLKCLLTVHHPYSLAIIHRIYDSIRNYEANNRESPDDYSHSVIPIRRAR